jgi:hypothetical protein
MEVRTTRVINEIPFYPHYWMNKLNDTMNLQKPTQLLHRMHSSFCFPINSLSMRTCHLAIKILIILIRIVYLIEKVKSLSLMLTTF